MLYILLRGYASRPPVITEVSPPGNMYNMNCCVCLLQYSLGYGRFLSSEERSVRMRILRSTLHITLKYIVAHAHITNTTSLQYTRSTDIHHARLIPRRGCRCDNRGLRSIPSDGRSVCIDNTPLSAPRRVCPSYILQRHGRHIYARS